MVESEIWYPIEDFPDYMISDEGRVFNTKAEIIMAPSKTMQGDLKVTMVNGSRRCTRSIRVLLAEACVTNPHPEQTDEVVAFDTVIVKDGNKDHIYPDNLAWRPWWFAHAYAQQFHTQLPSEYYEKPVYNTQSGRVYQSLIECAVEEGLLFNDVYKSITENVPIFPSNTTYIWADV